MVGRAQPLTDPGSLRLGPLAAWLTVSLSPLPWPLVLVAPLVLFPNGRARSPALAMVPHRRVGAGRRARARHRDRRPSGRHRRPVELLDVPGIPGTERPSWRSAWLAAPLVGFGAAIVALGGVLVAWRQADGLERRQYTTVLIGVSW